MVEAGLDVTLVMGGLPVKGLVQPGCRRLQLPAVKAGAAGFSALEDEDGRPVDDAFKLRRTTVLLDAFRGSQADVLLIEAFPFAAGPCGSNCCRCSNSPMPFRSVRSLRLGPRHSAGGHEAGRAEETLEMIERYFDLVIVHGDPDFARLDETFPLASAIAKEVLYTGLVAGPPPAGTVELRHSDFGWRRAAGLRSFARLQSS